MKQLSFILLIFILFSCCNDEEKTIKNRKIENVSSSIISNQKNIALFGSIDLKIILDKSKYAQIPLYGPFAESVLSDYLSHINLKKPVYYALEGPFDENYFSMDIKNEQSSTKFIFAEIKNNKALLAFMQKQGFEKRSLKKEQINYFFKSKLMFAVQGNILIAIIGCNEDEAKKKAISAFKNASKKENSQITKCLNKKGDLLVAVNLKELYNSSNTELNSLADSTKKSIEEMAENSFHVSIVNFQKGSMKIEGTNYFSPALTKELKFINSKGRKSIISQLGSGKPKAGIDLNMDFKELSKLSNKYFKQYNNILNQTVVGMFLPNTGLSGILDDILNGRISGLVYPEKNEFGGITPEFNLYVGLGKKGKKELQGIGNLFLSEMGDLSINNNSITLFTSNKYKPNKGDLIIHDEFVNFGNKPISCFVDLKDVDTREFEEMTYGSIKKIKRIYFEYDLEGGYLLVTTKDPDKNFLESLIDVGIEFVNKEFLNSIF